MNMRVPTNFAKISTTPLFVVLACAAFVNANVVAADTGQTVLTVSTSDANTELTLEALMAMPQTTFTTSTIWTQGDVTFTGVSLQDMFAAYGVTEGSVTAIAINDYRVSIPVSDTTENSPIIAYLLNGKEMHRRDKGPLWIVYPYDIQPSYDTETIYSRSIWQLNRLDTR